MQTRTWPYGTMKRAKVLEIRWGAMRGKRFPIYVVAELDSNEAHILVGGRSTGDVGDVGTITFLEGGPTGGYWRFKPDAAKGKPDAH